MLLDSVLITGANRGIGLEFVKQFLRLAKPPRYIFAVCRSSENAQDLKSIAASNKSLRILAMDVVDRSQYNHVVSNVRAIVGAQGLNLLINNAGIMQMVMDLQSHTKENMMQHFETNVIAPVLLTKAFFPLLKDAAEQGNDGIISAAVVNISTALGTFRHANSMPGHFPYKYSKVALNMFTQSLAEELHASGILMTAIHPGWVQTDMGGASAQITTEESVSGCIKIINTLDAKRRGKLCNWQGKEMPLFTSSSKL